MTLPANKARKVIEDFVSLIESNSNHIILSPTNLIFFIIFTLAAVSMLLIRELWELIQFIISLFTVSQVKKRIIDKERETLIQIFESLNGKNWKDKTHWCSSEPIHMWFGVKIDDNTGRVKKLILAENRLTGELPECIGDLIGLEEINMQFNEIRGKIPNSIVKLKNLRGLYLYDNFIEGVIPVGISDLPNLAGLYLYNNKFADLETTKNLFQLKLQGKCLLYI